MHLPSFHRKNFLSPFSFMCLFSFFFFFFFPLCYNLFCSSTEKKKEKPPGQKEKKEESHSNDQSPQTQASPSPQPSSQTLQTHRQTQESKSSAPAKRFSHYHSTELENDCNDTEFIFDNKSCETVHSHGQVNKCFDIFGAREDAFGMYCNRANT